MKQKPTQNKKQKFEEETYLKQQDHKDKERKKLTSSIYKNRRLPKSRRPYSRGK